jgi:hypothetical protein
MRLLMLFALLLLPVSAFAQSAALPPIGLQGSATVIHPAPGVDYYYDQKGNSTTVYRTAPHVFAYSSQDSHGRITTQGFLFDPHPRPEPLQTPSSQYRSAPEIDREACATAKDVALWNCAGGGSR